MYAIVEIKGQQFKAEEGKYLYVHHLGDEVKEGEAVTFDKVLLLDADGDVKVGAPAVEGAKVNAEVLVPLVKGEKDGMRANATKLSQPDDFSGNVTSLPRHIEMI